MHLSWCHCATLCDIVWNGTDLLPHMHTGCSIESTIYTCRAEYSAFQCDFLGAVGGQPLWTSLSEIPSEALWRPQVWGWSLAGWEMKTRVMILAALLLPSLQAGKLKKRLCFNWSYFLIKNLSLIFLFSFGPFFLTDWLELRYILITSGLNNSLNVIQQHLHWF